MSSVECMVMGLLNQGCKYGHELDKAIQDRQMRLWSKMTRATMYQALKRIEKKGWAVTSAEKEGNYPERTVYTLTESGKKALLEMVYEGLGGNEPMSFEICSYISFFSLLPVQQRLEQLEKRKAARTEVMNSISAAIHDDESVSPLGKRSNVRLIKAYYQMEIEWIESVISEIKSSIGENCP